MKERSKQPRKVKSPPANNLDRRFGPRQHNQEILEDLRTGLTTAQVAARHQVSKGRVSALRYYHKVGPPPPAFELDAVLADVRAGLTYQAIRERHRLTRTQLTRITSEHGLRRSRTEPHPTTQVILDDIRAGMSYSEAARKHGKSYDAIAHVGKKYGLNRPIPRGTPRKIPRQPPVRK
jgi:uncharacterized protein (DUF433 family)